MSRFQSNKPKSLKDLLSDFLESYPHKDKLKRGMVLSIWAETVGPAIAEQTERLYFKNGKLFVHVKNGVWRHEIHMKRYNIAQKLNEEVGDEIVKEIVVKS